MGNLWDIAGICSEGNSWGLLGTKKVVIKASVWPGAVLSAPSLKCEYYPYVYPPLPPVLSHKILTRSESMWSPCPKPSKL